MSQAQAVYDMLDNMGFWYDVVEHPPALTTAQADAYIEGMEGVRTKTLFLCNRRASAYYLLIMDDAKRMDMKTLEQLWAEKGLKFASAERLADKMGLPPGTVSPFGLMNNTPRDVRLYWDAEILTEPIMTFHPNDNSKTLFIRTGDMLEVLKTLGFEHRAITL